MNINLGEKLRKLRKEKGNTQEELAKFLNISVQSVSKWECGDGHPDITLLPSIAVYYSVTIDTLFGISEIEKNKRIEEIVDFCLVFDFCKADFASYLRHCASCISKGIFSPLCHYLFKICFVLHKSVKFASYRC